MTQIQVDLDEKENRIVRVLMSVFGVKNKPMTIKKMIRQYEKKIEKMKNILDE